MKIKRRYGENNGGQRQGQNRQGGTKVIPAEEKIIVEGMNIKKKAYETEKQGQRKGMSPKSRRHFTLPAPMIVCSSCGKTARTGYKTEGEKKSEFARNAEEPPKNKMNKFKEKFNKVAVPGMNKSSAIKTPLASPKIIKVVVSARHRVVQRRSQKAVLKIFHPDCQ